MLRTRLEQFTDHALLALCDLPLVTGIAILVAGFGQWSTISFYHSAIVVSLCYLTLSSFWASCNPNFVTGNALPVAEPVLIFDSLALIDNNSLRSPLHASKASRSKTSGTVEAAVRVARIAETSNGESFILTDRSSSTKKQVFVAVRPI